MKHNNTEIFGGEILECRKKNEILRSRINGGKVRKQNRHEP